MADCARCGHQNRYSGVGWKRSEFRDVSLKWVCDHCWSGLPSVEVVPAPRRPIAEYMPLAGVMFLVNLTWALVIILGMVR